MSGLRRARDVRLFDPVPCYGLPGFLQTIDTDRSPAVTATGAAVPSVYRGTEGRSGPVLFTLDVGGERFISRQAGGGGTVRLAERA